MPQISVIVPVYNVEPYLRRCVDSILNQTFTDFELILVDDGSPDGCGAIGDEYIDPRITVIHQPNGGVSAARNSGIDWAFACSDSEWLAFVDSDDWVHPQYLEYLHQAVCECNVTISACNFSRVSRKTKFAEVTAGAEILDWDKFLVSDNLTATVAWNKLYKKSLFGLLRYPKGKIHEDEYLTYRLLCLAGRVSLCSAILYYYYQNSAGIMGSPWSVDRLDRIEAYKEQYIFSKEHRYLYVAELALRHYIDAFAIEMAKLDEHRSSIPNFTCTKRRMLRRNALFVIQHINNIPFSKNRAFYAWSFPAIYKFYEKSKRIFYIIKNR